MDHLQLALDEPPAATFRPVLRALRLHAVEAGSPWTAIELLDVEMAAAGTVAAKAELAVQKAGLLENPLRARERARAVIEEALALVPGHTAALLALEESAIRGGDAALLQSVLDRRLAAAASAGERGRLLCRLALLAEADPDGTAEALDLWLRALDEDAGQGRGGARARRDPAGGGARRSRTRALARAVELEAEAAAGPERAAWLGLAAALARYRLGATARAVALIEEARDGGSERSRRCCIVSAANHLEAGQWTKARLCLDHHAEISNDKDWGATLAGFGAHLAEHHEGDDEAAAARYRRLLERAAGRSGRRSSRWNASPRARATRRRRCGWRRRRWIAAATRPSARRWRCAPRSWPRRRRTICRGRPVWPGARSRPCPGYAPAAHLLERLYATLGQWGELVKVVEVSARRRPSASDRAAAAGRRARGARRARETSTRFERVGALYEERLQDPGKALALYGEWAELGERRPAALRALLRAAEKAGDALVAAEAALKLGTEIPELPARRPVRVVLPRGGDLRGARRGRRRGGARLRGGAGARSRLAAGAGGAGARALPGPPAGGAGGGAAQAGGLRAEPGQRQRAGRRGRPRLRVPAGAGRRRAGGDGARAVAGSVERRRDRGARASAGRASGAATELAEALGSLGQALADPIDKAAAYRLQAEICEWQLGVQARRRWPRSSAPRRR